MTWQTWAILFLAWGTVDFVLCYLIYLHKQKTKVMKVGSLVECVNDHKGHLVSQGFAKPIKTGCVYTVRGFHVCSMDGSTGLYLEEINNNPLPWTEVEPGYRIERFRELQPPMDLSFIEEMQMIEQAKVLK